MKERLIMTIGDGQMEAFIRALGAVTDYCIEQGYDARIRTGEHGYEIYLPATEDKPSDPQP